MPSTFRRKPNRLPLEVYRGAGVYFLTLTCAQRQAVFTEKRLVESCIETLRFCSERHGFAILAYCFMPDHLHLLVEGRAGSDVPQFMKDFKQRTGYAYRRVSEEALWQKSYYDHILRKEEDVREAARYIIGNPVRMGLVEAAGDHPYSGSFAWGKAIMEAEGFRYYIGFAEDRSAQAIRRARAPGSRLTFAWADAIMVNGFSLIDRPLASTLTATLALEGATDGPGCPIPR